MFIAVKQHHLQSWGVLFLLWGARSVLGLLFHSRALSFEMACSYLVGSVSPTAGVFYCWGGDIYSGLVTPSLPFNATHTVSVSWGAVQDVMRITLRERISDQNDFIKRSVMTFQSVLYNMISLN